MNLSLCITHYNRFELLKESFAQVIDDPRINDIVILDDASTDGSYDKIVEYYKCSNKVRVIRQAQNRGMQQNKRDAIAYAKNDRCIIFDSDNVIGPDYLDAFYNNAGGAMELIDGSERYIFCPDFALPEFDYREYRQGGKKGHTFRSGIYDTREAKIEIKNDSFNCLLNTCNYIVHRGFYLKTYQHNPAHIASDTIWHNYNHLKACGKFWVVPGMQYYHRVHKGSGFLQGVDHNMKMQAEVRKMIMNL